MAVDDDYDDRRHLARDVRDAHMAAATAKTLATIAIIVAAISMALSVMAWNKSNDAWGNAQRAVNISEQK
jgi:TRAP-type C4-dicarboxylate transport system permease small subunit